MMRLRSHRVAALTIGAGTALTPCALLGQVVEMASPLGNSSHYFGAGLSAIPDVDGDGQEDILIGAFGDFQLGRPSVGRVYIFSGATFQLLRTLARPLDEGPSKVPENFGLSVGVLPDLGGEGHPGVVVGAYSETPPGAPNHSGRVHVFSGVTGDHLLTLASPDDSFACNFGTEVAGLADIDGDGKGDFIVAAIGFSCRRVFAFSGGSGEVIFPFESPYGSPSFGDSLSAVPDVDGDGVADIAIGSISDEPPGNPPGSGRVFIYSGATGELLRELQSPNPVPRKFGALVEGVPDIDGDGFGEVLVGSEDGNPGEPSRAGSAHLYSGATGVLLRSFSSQMPSLNGQCYAIGVLPDIDGDGRADLALGSGHETPPGRPSQSGVVYLYSGATGRHLRTLLTPNPREFGRAGGPTTGIVHPASPTRRATILMGGITDVFGQGRVYGFPACRADADADGRINSNDISRFLTGWVQTFGSPPGTLPPPGVHHGDYNGDGAVSPADITGFLDRWLAAVAADGCP